MSKAAEERMLYRHHWKRSRKQQFFCVHLLDYKMVQTKHKVDMITLNQ
jgi:hypothetical protein